MTVSFRDEFRLRNFGLDYDKPYQFAVSQWRGMSDGVFIAWRVFWATWHIGWLARSVQVQVDKSDNDAGESAKWLIFLTNWSYLILTLQSVIYLFIVIHTRFSHDGKPTYQTGENNPWYNKVLWMFNDISFAAAIIVTIFYWTLIFKELSLAVSIMTHAVNSFYVLTDLFISASPSRILHFIYPIFYAISYVLFSLIYHALDGTNDDGKPFIYSALDWSSTGPTAGRAIAIAFIATPLAHLFLFGIYTLRCYIAQSCCGEVAPEDEEDIPENGKAAADIEEYKESRF